MAVLKDHLSLETKVRMEAEQALARLNKQIADMTKAEQALDDALTEEKARR